MEQRNRTFADASFSMFPFHHGTNIIPSIFLICGVNAGVPALLWTLMVICHNHKTRENGISAFIVLLIINDILELLLNLYVIVKLFRGDRCEEPTCRVWLSLWTGLRVCGVFLQQMMVLETDLGLIHSFCSAYVLFVPCSIIFSVSFFLCYFLPVFSSSPPSQPFHLLPPVAVIVTLCTVIYGISPSEIPSSDRTRKHGYVGLPCGVFTMVLYLLYLIAYLSQSSWGLLVMCLLSVRVTIDSLLCVVVCREKIPETPPEPKPGERPNSQLSSLRCHSRCIGVRRNGDQAFSTFSP